MNQLTFWFIICKEVFSHIKNKSFLFILLYSSASSFQYFIFIFNFIYLSSQNDDHTDDSFNSITFWCLVLNHRMFQQLKRFEKNLISSFFLFLFFDFSSCFCFSSLNSFLILFLIWLFNRFNRFSAFYHLDLDHFVWNERTKHLRKEKDLCIRIEWYDHQHLFFDFQFSIYQFPISILSNFSTSCFFQKFFIPSLLASWSHSVPFSLSLKSIHEMIALNLMTSNHSHVWMWQVILWCFSFLFNRRIQGTND